jgi:hypothetical protein
MGEGLHRDLVDSTIDGRIRVSGKSCVSCQTKGRKAILVGFLKRQRSDLREIQ